MAKEGRQHRLPRGSLWGLPHRSTRLAHSVNRAWQGVEEQGMAAVQETVRQVEEITNSRYKHGFFSDIEMETAPKGLSEDTIRFISAKKNEPEWLLEWRLKAFRLWQ